MEQLRYMFDTDKQLTVYVL